MLRGLILLTVFSMAAAQTADCTDACKDFFAVFDKSSVCQANGAASSSGDACMLSTCSAADSYDKCLTCRGVTADEVKRYKELCAAPASSSAVTSQGESQPSQTPSSKPSEEANPSAPSASSASSAPAASSQSSTTSAASAAASNTAQKSSGNRAKVGYYTLAMTLAIASVF